MKLSIKHQKCSKIWIVYYNGRNNFAFILISLPNKMQLLHGNLAFSFLIKLSI